MRAIIPAAGFGTRMNMRPNESKEMLIDPQTNKPIIQYSLDLCAKYNLEPVVITRSKKRDLIDYCEKNNIFTQIVEPEGEWMNTVLMSHEHWSRHNILILPDTRFNPTDIIIEIKKDLELGANSSIALHKVNDSQNWCVVRQYTLAEKPTFLTGEQQAFGVIGFTNTSGHVIFTDLKAHKYHILDSSSFRYLYDFKDLTRTGKLE